MVMNKNLLMNSSEQPSNLDGDSHAEKFCNEVCSQSTNTVSDEGGAETADKKSQTTESEPNSNNCISDSEKEHNDQMSNRKFKNGHLTKGEIVNGCNSISENVPSPVKSVMVLNQNGEEDDQSNIKLDRNSLLDDDTNKEAVKTKFNDKLQDASPTAVVDDSSNFKNADGVKMVICAENPEMNNETKPVNGILPMKIFSISDKNKGKIKDVSPKVMKIEGKNKIKKPRVVFSQKKGTVNGKLKVDSVNIKKKSLLKKKAHIRCEPKGNIGCNNVKSSLAKTGEAVRTVKFDNSEKCSITEENSEGNSFSGKGNPENEFPEISKNSFPENKICASSPSVIETKLKTCEHKDITEAETEKEKSINSDCIVDVETSNAESDYSKLLDDLEFDKVSDSKESKSDIKEQEVEGTGTTRRRRTLSKSSSWFSKEMQEQCCGHWFPSTKSFVNHLIENSIEDSGEYHSNKLLDIGMDKCPECLQWVSLCSLKRHYRRRHPSLSIPTSHSSTKQSHSSNGIQQISSNVRKEKKNIIKLSPSPRESLKADDEDKDFRTIKKDQTDTEEKIICNIDSDSRNESFTLYSERDLPPQFKPSIKMKRCSLDSKNINVNPISNGKELKYPIISSDESSAGSSDDFEASSLKSKKKTNEIYCSLSNKSSTKTTKKTSRPSLDSTHDFQKDNLHYRKFGKRSKKSLNDSMDTFNRNGMSSRGRGRGSKVYFKRRKCGFNSSESSDSSSCVSDTALEDDIFQVDWSDKEDDVPTVELDLFTLNNQQDESLLLVDRQNPDFKVFASMEAIFVGDAALYDVTNQMGYISDMNNVVFVNPDHFLFPSLQNSNGASEDKVKGKGKLCTKSKKSISNTVESNTTSKIYEMKDTIVNAENIVDFCNNKENTFVTKKIKKLSKTKLDRSASFSLDKSEGSSLDKSIKRKIKIKKKANTLNNNNSNDKSLVSISLDSTDMPIVKSINKVEENDSKSDLSIIKASNKEEVVELNFGANDETNLPTILDRQSPNPKVDIALKDKDVIIKSKSPKFDKDKSQTKEDINTIALDFETISSSVSKDNDLIPKIKSANNKKSRQEKSALFSKTTLKLSKKKQQPIVIRAKMKSDKENNGIRKQNPFSTDFKHLSKPVCPTENIQSTSYKENDLSMDNQDLAPCKFLADSENPLLPPDTDFSMFESVDFVEGDNVTVSFDVASTPTKSYKLHNFRKSPSIKKSQKSNEPLNLFSDIVIEKTEIGTTDTVIDGVCLEDIINKENNEICNYQKTPTKKDKTEDIPDQLLNVSKPVLNNPSSSVKKSHTSNVDLTGFLKGNTLWGTPILFLPRKSPVAEPNSDDDDLALSSFIGSNFKNKLNLDLKHKKKKNKFIHTSNKSRMIKLHTKNVLKSLSIKEQSKLEKARKIKSGFTKDKVIKNTNKKVNSKKFKSNLLVLQSQNNNTSNSSDDGGLLVVESLQPKKVYKKKKAAENVQKSPQNLKSVDDLVVLKKSKTTPKKKNTNDTDSSKVSNSIVSNDIVESESLNLSKSIKTAKKVQKSPQTLKSIDNLVVLKKKKKSKTTPKKNNYNTDSSEVSNSTLSYEIVESESFKESNLLKKKVKTYSKLKRDKKNGESPKKRNSKAVCIQNKVDGTSAIKLTVKKTSEELDVDVMLNNSDHSGDTKCSDILNDSNMSATTSNELVDVEHIDITEGQNKGKFENVFDISKSDITDSESGNLVPHLNGEPFGSSSGNKKLYDSLKSEASSLNVSDNEVKIMEDSVIVKTQDESTNAFETSIDKSLDLGKKSKRKGPLSVKSTSELCGPGSPKKKNKYGQIKIPINFKMSPKKSETSKAQTPILGKKRGLKKKSDTKDIRSFFSPPETSASKELQTPDFCTSSPVEESSEKNKIVTDTPVNVEQKTKLSKKKSKLKKSSQDIRNFFCSPTDKQDLDFSPPPKKRKLHLPVPVQPPQEQIDFEGFSDNDDILKHRSKELFMYVDVINLNTMFSSSKFSLPVDQLCDWNDDLLNVILFEKG